MLQLTSKDTTISSKDLLDIINNHRWEAGEKPIRYNDFFNRITDELEGENYETFVVKNQNSTESQIASLNIDQCSLVAMRESKVVRRKGLDAIKSRQPQALSLPNFADPVAAARAWADAVEQRQVAEQQLALAAPKVEFVDKYVTATGNLGFRQVAKLLKVKEAELRDFLIGRRIMYRLAGALTPYAEHIEVGRFTVKAGVAEHGDTSHAYSQTKFTPKGVEWLAGELAKNQARQAVSANSNGGAE